MRNSLHQLEPQRDRRPASWTPTSMYDCICAACTIPLLLPQYNRCPLVFLRSNIGAHNTLAAAVPRITAVSHHFAK